MASHIPFISTASDWSIFREYYSDSETVRVSLAAKITIPATSDVKIWVDPSVDFYDNHPPREGSEKSLSDFERSWQYFSRFDPNGLMTRQASTRKVDRQLVAEFVSAILDECFKRFHPHWLSVPQQTLIDRRSRNLMNRVLAEATAAWCRENPFRGKLILPVILNASQKDIVTKPFRDAVVGLVADCYETSKADGIWVADCRLDEQGGSEELSRKRFPMLVKLHGELKKALPPGAMIIAGPYWGMNLVLWSQGLATHPAIGLGRGYRYYPPGHHTKTSKARIAIPPLRRLAEISNLEPWIRDAMKQLGSNHPERGAFEHLLRLVSSPIGADRARHQIAEFYKGWVDSLQRIPPAGRALALYQDLSGAFITGRLIKHKLPQESGNASHPERVAQQLMLNCL